MGTQAEMIQSKYRYSSTLPVAILCEEAEDGITLGNEAGQFTNHGRLVPNAMVNRLGDAWLGAARAELIFDGYPHTLGQATGLDGVRTMRGPLLEVGLSLEVDAPTMRDRMERRLICSGCGARISVGLHVAGKSDPCPSFGGVLEKRDDDTAETLPFRMRQYANKTAPIISYYTEQDLVQPVESSHLPAADFATISPIPEGA